MKKQYTAPKVEVINVDSSEIICTSFGDGTTGTMHAKENDFDEDLENLIHDIMWNE